MEEHTHNQSVVFFEMCVCGVLCLGVSCNLGLGAVSTYALKSLAFGICRLPSPASGQSHTDGSKWDERED